jgi:hypothetical protein
MACAYHAWVQFPNTAKKKKKKVKKQSDITANGRIKLPKKPPFHKSNKNTGKKIIFLEL